MRLSLALAAFLTATSLVVPTAHSAEVKGVVELFTSQGCSSCPPADKVFGEIIQQNGVIGLAWHVDYWNYLGWKDTFSLAESTERQRAYARGLNARGVYTPQIIVNGDTVAENGSFKQSIAAALNGHLPVPVSAKVGDSSLVVEAGKGSGAANLILVMFNREDRVAIERGENAGTKVTYHHAVSDVHTIGMWKGEALKVELPLDEYVPTKGMGCAVLLQRVDASGAPGAILGAAIIENPGAS